MRQKKWGIILAVMTVIAVLALFGCSSGDEQSASSGNATSTEAASTSGDSSTAGEYALVNDGTLTVAASLDFPPFENMPEGSTEAEGFSVDLMKAVGNEMGLEVVYLPSTQFDAIIPLIQTGGSADVGVSSFTISPERLEQVDFTETYMDSNQGVVVMKDSGYTSVQDLEGKTIGAQSGTTGYDWAVENIPNANVIPFTEMTAVFLALASDQVQGVVADLPVVQYYVSHSYPDAEIIAEIPTGEQYGIAVNKDNPELTEALNQALETIRENGTYDQIYQEWFGVSPS